MAINADGGLAVLPSMPDFSAYNFSSAGDMKFHLQNLLDSKEKQLQQAGTLGQRVLAQQMELEERIRQLQEIDADKEEDEEIDSEARDRYRELAETIKGWDTENAQLSSAFGGAGAKRFVNGSQPSPSLSFSDLPREEPERSKASAGTSAAQSRRAKNAAHRADDVEFAFEIGSGLLTEVRRLQSLLGERDKAIQDMKEEKDDLEKSVESLRITLRQQEQSADKFKEENWNLEVTLQELRTQLSDSQADAHRLEGEHKRLTKLLSVARDTGEQHKNESQRLKENLEELKVKHETDVAHARKHAAGLQRDKSDLQQAVDNMKVEVARAAKRLPFGGSPYTPNGPARSDFLTPVDKDDDDVFSASGASTNRRKYDTSALFPADGFGSDFADSSPDPSPVRPILASNHPSNEIEALQQRLAHAQRQINTLKGTLQREKELRMDYRRKLAASPGQAVGEGEEVEDEMDYEDVDGEVKTKRSAASRPSARVRGRGRGRGMTLIERMAAHSPSSEFNDEPVDDDTPPLPVPPIPIRFHGADEDLKIEELEREDESGHRSPSPLEAPSNRTSVDGMDPAFANVLRRTPSYSGSPLRQSVMAKSARGGTIGRRKGGAAYQEARPPSLVGQPEALAAELGLGESPVDEQQVSTKVAVETVEFGCQTDFEEPAPPPPPAPAPPIPVKPASTDMAVQVDPEPVPLPVSVLPVVTYEISTQTDEEPVIARSDVAVQHDVPRPVLVSTSVNTDPELLPLVPVKVHVETQTPKNTVNVDTQTPVYLTKDQSQWAGQDDWRTTITQYDISRTSSMGNSSGNATITRAPTRVFLSGIFGEDDGEETETGADTDTDTDDYQDAVMSTPTESVNDFHSVQTMTDNDFHSVQTMTDNDFSESDDDGESIKVSRIASQLTGSSRPSSYITPVVSYESKAISAAVAEVPKPEVPKPELKEMCIQTDEWTPPTPPSSAPPIPPPSPGFSLYRVGSSGQQFQFVAPPSATASPPAGPVSAPLSSNVFRDSTATFGPRSRTSHSERRQSMESIISSVMDEGTSRSRVPSGTLAPVDKTKPPMMVLPPPPRLPPPTNMPPPSFIPERKVLPNIFYDGPPPRPSSPPPAELIQRATTPTFGSVLSVPGGKGSYGPRQHGSSMPPSQQNLRQLPSTSSFRSAANAASHAMNSVAPSGTLTSFSVRENRIEFSSTSLASERTMASPRSSLSSDHTPYLNRPQGLPKPPVTPNKNANTTIEGAPGSSTDPAIIHAITQTMIGEFLYKYTRRAIGKGYGERRHKRFFWVHPYTKTLYWSSADPGSSNVSESSAKSAYIDGVRSVLDPNPMPPGLYQYSVVVSTPQREMKFTAPTKERHDIWLNALKYLLARPSAMNVASPGDTVVPQSPVSVQGDTTDEDHRQAPKSSPQSQRSGRSPRNGDSWNTTPRGQRSRSQLSVGGSIGKRSGTPAAEYLRWNLPESPYSPTKSFEHVLGQADGDLDFELHGGNLSDEGFEGLENVRACCDGRHTVGHHHHHHPHDHLHNGDHHSESNPPEQVRPVSPSAWSFRSRTGSSNSHEGGIFSWGRKEDGKLRFGSRRSTKTVPTHDQ